MKYSEAKQYLKEGMTVRVVEAKHPTCKQCSGEVGEYDGNGVGRHGWDCWMDNDELEILTNPDGSKWVQPDQKFKVGDRVRQVEFGWGTSPEDNGKEAIVKEVRGIEIAISPLGDWEYEQTWRREEGFKKIEEPKMTIGEMLSVQRPGKNSFYEDLCREWASGYQEHAYQSIKQFYSMDLAEEPKKKGKIMSAVSFVKKQALKMSNPDEYELREAGLHNSDGDLTIDGAELRDQFLEKLVLKEMVETAKDINAEKEKKLPQLLILKRIEASHSLVDGAWD